MKEKDIRDPNVHKQYLELVKQDSMNIFKDTSTFTNIPCPACNGTRQVVMFEKDKFQYVQCSDCETIYNNPRPSFTDIEKLYRSSESTKFWVDHFFSPFKEARREKMFKPRAEYIAAKFPGLHTAVIGDIGAGFGIFLEELRNVWKQARLVAIEPSDDMAALCRTSGFDVIQSMVEDVDPARHSFDLLTSFELVEHLHDPKKFFTTINSLLKPSGYFYFTTLNGQGFDIQMLWEKSKSISPPHHLNFFNTRSIAVMLEYSGFEAVEISTPGKLDWDIVESTVKNDHVSIGRFFDILQRHGTEEAKNKFQVWLSEYNFSSHLRVIARKL